MFDDLKNAIDVLYSGGVILYPTDTVWGLGCDATNESAVKKVYDIKQRIDSKAMVILVDTPSRLQSYVDEVPDVAWDLIELSEKPLTIIYPHARNLPKNLIGADKSIGIRVTNEEFSQKLCARFRRPIVSTSANISGCACPETFIAIAEEVKMAVDYVVTYRQQDQKPSKPSSIIKFSEGGAFQLIRE